jgi:polyphosphate kinase
MSGLAPAIRLKRILQSPFTLHPGLLKKIEREAANARAGKPSGIIAKLNAINEPKVIRALYHASQAGVKVELIVRGACGLRPGVKGVSENIRVRSIIGRFLEHSRIYWFANGGEPELYASSADWMERNLLRRIETCVPILDPALAERVRTEELDNYLRDNTQAWELKSDGSYARIEPAEDEMPHSAQQFLLALLCH